MTYSNPFYWQPFDETTVKPAASEVYFDDVNLDSAQHSAELDAELLRWSDDGGATN